MPSYALEIDFSQMEVIRKEMEKITFFDKSPRLRAGLKDAAEIVKKRLRGKITKPGYPGDKKGKKPLKQTVRSRMMRETPTILVGYAYPAGAHGHLLEEGHRQLPHKGGTTPTKSTPGSTVPGKRDHYGAAFGFWVDGRHWLKDAGAETQGAQFAAIEASLKSQEWFGRAA
tara:strand:- start:3944 stop:4456 length:513 start_codon:yes stop_codon:yes gene_type:complete